MFLERIFLEKIFHQTNKYSFQIEIMWDIPAGTTVGGDLLPSLSFLDDSKNLKTINKTGCTFSFNNVLRVCKIMKCIAYYLQNGLK